MKIGHIQSRSLKMSHHLQATQRVLERTLKRMSAGSSLAGGLDAVKLHQAAHLEASVRSFRQSILGLNSSRALYETASEGLRSQIEIVQKMQELALQGSNETLSVTEREEIQIHLVAFREEFERIAQDTRWGERALLDGSSSAVSSSVSADILQKNEALNTFQSAQTTSQVNSGTGVLMDANGDGTNDLVSVDTTSGVIQAALFGESGEKIGQKSTNMSGSSSSIVSTDVNSDGLDDLIIGLDIYLSNGDGSFAAGGSLDHDQNVRSAMYLSDQNGDGVEDLLFIDALDRLVVMLGNEEGNFQSAITSSTTYVYDFNVGDINGDGVDDVAYLSGTSSVTWAFSNGDGTFQPGSALNSLFTFIGDIALGDVTGDAKVELFIRDGMSNTLRIYMGDSSGYSVSAQSILAMALSNMKVVDWNSDGTGDLVGSEGSNIYLFRGYSSLSATLTAGASVSQILFGGLSGDGFEDFIGLSNAGDSFSIFERNKKKVTAIADLHVRDVESAQASLEILEEAQDLLTQKLIQIETQAGSVSRYQDYLMRQQSTHEEVYEQLVSIDLAQEMADLVQAQIAQEAQMAALAQSNLQSRMVLELLRGISGSR